MKILVLTSVFPRWKGDATPPFVQNHCELMTKIGFDVRLLAPHSSTAAFSENINGLEVRRFPYAFPFSIEKLCYEGGILINLRYRPWTYLLLPILIVSQIIATIYQVICFRPEVIHSHSLLPQGLTGSFVAQVFGLDHITTSHGNDVFGLPQTGILGFMKKWVLQRSYLITVNSSETRSAVLALGAEEEKIHLLPAVANESPVNAELVEEMKQQFKAARRILFVGRLIEEKGVSDLLLAFAELNPWKHDLICIIAGEGAQRRALESLAKELEIENYTKFVGWQTREAIPSLMAACDVLVVPSKPVGNWIEAQGLVVVEAMLSGLLVVASELGGITDMIEDGKTGWLFPPGDVSKITTVLNNVLFSCEDVQKKITHDAKKKAHAEFSSLAISRKTHTLYAILK